MSKLNEYTDYLAAFSSPEYQVDKRYHAVFLGKNKEICYLDNSDTYSILVCPLLNDLTEEDINSFKLYAYKCHAIENIVTVDGGTRGKGIFGIFKRGNR